MLRELFAPNIQRIESIRSIRAVLQKVLFRFRILLCGFVLAEAIATAFHTSRLNGKDKVIIVLAVEVRHQPLFASKALVDEQVLLIMSHRVAEVNILHLPTMAFKFMDDHPVKVLIVDGIVRAKGSGIVVEDDRVVGMGRVVRAEVGNERRDFALKLDVKGFEYVQAIATRLTTDNPVDIGIVVHANAKRRHRVNVRVRAAIEGRVKRREVGE